MGGNPKATPCARLVEVKLDMDIKEAVARCERLYAIRDERKRKAQDDDKFVAMLERNNLIRGRKTWQAG